MLGRRAVTSPRKTVLMHFMEAIALHTSRVNPLEEVFCVCVVSANHGVGYHLLLS